MIRSGELTATIVDEVDEKFDIKEEDVNEKARKATIKRKQAVEMMPQMRAVFNSQMTLGKLCA